MVPWTEKEGIETGSSRLRRNRHEAGGEKN